MQPPGREALSAIFPKLGYRHADDFEFPTTNLSAVHLEHPGGALPKLFISQLEVDRLPKKYAELIRGNAERTDNSFPDYSGARATLDAALRGDVEVPRAAGELAALFRRPWAPPDRAAPSSLNDASQYGAWVLLHGNAVNHFTTLINAQGVSDWPDIEATVQGLREAGVPVKDTIEGERRSRLWQDADFVVRRE